MKRLQKINTRQRILSTIENTLRFLLDTESELRMVTATHLWISGMARSDRRSYWIAWKLLLSVVPGTSVGCPKKMFLVVTPSTIPHKQEIMSLGGFAAFRYDRVLYISYINVVWPIHVISLQRFKNVETSSSVDPRAEVISLATRHLFHSDTQMKNASPHLQVSTSWTLLRVHRQSLILHVLMVLHCTKGLLNKP